MLLALVYGTFLVIVGVTATMQAVLVGTHFSTNALNTIVETDAGVVRAFADEQLRPSDFAGGTLPADREATLRAALGAFSTTRGIVHAEVRQPDGTVLVSDAPVAGAVAPPNGDVTRALADGQAAASFVDRDQPAGAAGDIGGRPYDPRGVPLARRRRDPGGRRAVARRQPGPRPARRPCARTSSW